MTPIRLGGTAIAGVLVALLTACGGGGSDPSESVSTPATAAVNVPSTTRAPIGLVSAISSSLPAYAATGSPAADMTGWLNTVRQAMGVSTVAITAGLQQAAQNHSNYEVVNQLGGHTETRGTPDFTGATPDDRITAVYPSANYTGEVTVYYSQATFTTQPTGVYAVQQLFDAPFHRIGMLADVSAMGAGYSTDYSASRSVTHSAFTIDFANIANQLPANQFVVYPYAGQTGVPLSWVANESPNPFQDASNYIGATVGYPVTIQGAVGDRLTVSSFSIAAASGASVSCLEVDPSSSSLGSELFGAALCAPYQVYAPNTQYTATVSGTKNGRQFTVQWSWTTGVQ